MLPQYSDRGDSRPFLTHNWLPITILRDIPQSYVGANSSYPMGLDASNIARLYWLPQKLVITGWRAVTSDIGELNMSMAATPDPLPGPKREGCVEMLDEMRWHGDPASPGVGAGVSGSWEFPEIIPMPTAEISMSYSPTCAAFPGEDGTTPDGGASYFLRFACDFTASANQSGRVAIASTFIAYDPSYEIYSCGSVRLMEVIEGDKVRGAVATLFSRRLIIGNDFVNDPVESIEIVVDYAPWPGMD